MRRSPSSALLPLAEALAQLQAISHPVPPKRCPLAAAFGAVSAQDILAPRGVPACPTAVRDGWAVAFADVAGASPSSPVPLAAPARWVEAADAMPDGTDVVLPPDAIDASGREADAEVAPGDGIALPGSELRGDETLIAAGEMVSARALLVLAAAGFRDIEVRRPRVAMIAARHGRFDLLPALSSLVSEAGGEAMPVEAPSAAASSLLVAIGRASETADAIFVVGGTGFGRRDDAASALAEVGPVVAHGIGIRPGDTTGFGSAGARPVLLIPGRPDGALAVFALFARPLLRWLSGGTVQANGMSLPLTRKVSSALGVSEVIFARRSSAGVEPLGSAGVPLRRLLQADRFILVPPRQEGYPDGHSVETMPLWTSR